MLDLQRENDWTFDRLAEEMAAQRQIAARMQAEELAQVAGKSDQQIALEEQAAEQRQKILEPQIQRPDCLSNGIAPDARSPEEREQIRIYLAEKKYALPNTVPSAPELQPIPGTICRQDGELSSGWLLKPAGRAMMIGMQIGADIRWSLFYPLLEVSRIAVRGPEEAERRVTKPRAAAFGLFSQATKKEYKHAYLLLENHAEAPLVYRVDGLDAIQLEGHLSPLLNWYELYGADIRELYQLWNPV
jgi:hypothetical protein